MTGICIRMAAMDSEQRHKIHCPRMDISLYLSEPLSSSVCERLKAGEVWEGFLEYVDLQVSEWEIESNLISGAKFTLAVMFSLYLLPHLLTKDTPTSWAAVCTYSVSKRWKSQTSHSWFTWADLAGRPLTSYHFGSRESPAAPGRTTK